MTRIAGLVVVTVLGLAPAAPVAASPIHFTDLFNPADTTFTKSTVTCTGTNGSADSTAAGTCTTLSWLHVLDGFNPATDVLDQASLSVWLYDDGDNAAEKYDLTLDLLSDTRRKITSETTMGVPFTYSYDVLGALADGQLLATLTVVNGDFTFARSLLTASGEAADLTPVPEPASIFLLGTGLALAARARRRRSL